MQYIDHIPSVVIFVHKMMSNPHVHVNYDRFNVYCYYMISIFYRNKKNIIFFFQIELIKCKIKTNTAIHNNEANVIAGINCTNEYSTLIATETISNCSVASEYCHTDKN